MWFDIHTAHPVPFPLKFLDQVTAYKTACTAHQGFLHAISFSIMDAVIILTPFEIGARLYSGRVSSHPGSNGKLFVFPPGGAESLFYPIDERKITPH
jgi:hypothetical protein